MIRLHAISADNEMPVAERLVNAIRLAWPDLAGSQRDHIDVLVGVRTPIDVDILILMDLQKARELLPERRRVGGKSPATHVQCALIAIEVKQLDADRFTRVGNQWFPVYGRNGGRETSVAVQARKAAFGVSQFARQSGYAPFVHAIAWLTEVDEAMLSDIEPMILGREATWFGILDAAMQQSAVLAQAGSPEVSLALRTVRERLLNRRKSSARDRKRIDTLSRDLASSAVVDAIASRCGTSQIRLIGRGGSGKTTSLALLAVRLAEMGERVLILTFHRTLRNEIAHLIDALALPAGVPPNRLGVETMMGFLFSALDALGAEIPSSGVGPDYTAVERVLDETRCMLFGTHESVEGDVARLRSSKPERFSWDHIFVDEAQDCSDAERDFLRALYGHHRFVLADGVDQLVRRQVACDWQIGVPLGERATFRLENSLRMLRNVAIFANCMARALGLDTWRISPQEQLAGGRIIIATGDIVLPKVLEAIVRSAAANKADPVDCLVCLPPTVGEMDRRADILVAAAAAGVSVWDGTIAETRAGIAPAREALRLVRYDSCRGLEGWITLALDIDDLVKNKLRYPNLNANDAPVEPEVVANRFMMIPLTRAVHTLVISVRDAESSTARHLREATSDPALPRGVVEWVRASELAATLAPVHIGT